MNATHLMDVHDPDMTLVGGKLVTVDQNATVAEALAIRYGKISAIGSSTEIRMLAGPRTTIVELDGRTVIPGLIDSHLHAIRDGRTFVVRLDWCRVSTLKQALDTIRVAGRETSPGSWIIVIGGWDPYQLAERRSPTPQELDDAAPDHPVYVQQLYDLAVLNRRWTFSRRRLGRPERFAWARARLRLLATRTGVVIRGTFKFRDRR